jgi:hypothetical protein
VKLNAVPLETNDIKINLTRKLHGLGIGIKEIKDCIEGPMVSAFPIVLDSSTPLSKLMNKAEDLALAVGVDSVDLRRVGREVHVFIPNKEKKIVNFQEAAWWMANNEEAKACGIPILLGMDYTGNKSFLDLTKQPHILLAGSTGSGKAQPVNEIVLTPSGYKRMGNLRLGDYVIGSDGKATEIIAVYPQGSKEIVRMKFHDGSSVTCCLDHLWKVQDRFNRTKGKRFGKWQVLSTREIANNLRHQSGTNSYKNYSIHLIDAPIEFDAEDLKINPYLLGVLLGDGSFRNPNTPNVTSIDEFIIKKIDKLLPNAMLLSWDLNFGYRIVDRNSSKSRKNTLRLLLDDLGLWGKNSKEKFIPISYKLGSSSDRSNLLQGLMDTDGTVDKSGKSITFNTSSEVLANDVVFLVQSLGGIAKVSSRFPSYKDASGNKVLCSKAFRVDICLPNNIKPFSIPRKANRVMGKVNYLFTRYIDSIEYIGTKECQCITVAAKDNLYVTKDFIVTHNSVFEVGLATALALSKSVDELQMILVDTKLVELTLLKNLPHVQSVIISAIQYYEMITNLQAEVNRRMQLFAHCGVRNLAEYNAQIEEQFKLPYVLLLIDELADLIDKDKEVRSEIGKKHDEPKVMDSLRKLLRVSRAAGIHVIAGTQRVSGDIVAPEAKTNFPARISLKLPSSRDSEFILDEKGAENLLGNGDMLVKENSVDIIKRFHAPFIELADIKYVIDNLTLAKSTLQLET